MSILVMRDRLPDQNLVGCVVAIESGGWQRRAVVVRVADDQVILAPSWRDWPSAFVRVHLLPVDVLTPGQPAELISAQDLGRADVLP